MKVESPIFVGRGFYPLSTLWYFDLAMEHHHVAKLQRNRSQWGDELLSHGHSPVTKNPCLRGCHSAMDPGINRCAQRFFTDNRQRQARPSGTYPSPYHSKEMKRSVKSGPLMTSGASSPDCPAIPGCTRNQNKVPSGFLNFNPQKLGLKLQEFGYKNKGKLYGEKI